MAKIAMIVEKPIRRGRCRSEVYSPVHKGLAAPDSENNGIELIDRRAFDEHSFRALTPIRINMCLAFRTDWAVVDILGILCSKAK